MGGLMKLEPMNSPKNIALEQLLLRIDRLAGGRQASVSIPPNALAHEKTVSAFRWIRLLLIVELVLGLGAAGYAVFLAEEGGSVPLSARMRTMVVLAMTATLFYSAWPASLGWRWASMRLRLFSQIFPVITLVLSAIPGLYPAWMVTEQIVFSLIMMGLGDFLTSDHIRDASRRPGAADRPNRTVQDGHC
jgi:hypothetical protein